MMTNMVSINGCRHYIANEAGSERLYFFDTRFLVDVDYEMKHPLGLVYKARNVLDTNVRYVLQPDRSILVFNKTEWERKKNPFNSLLPSGFVDDCRAFIMFLKRLKSGKKSTVIIG